ncbi:molybdopterin converting factor small subunit [Agromyces flavus]|uniref:Molybdopterin converting factor small subunit n=1 Tax=Agromyces flavus TaxID=589382 RepID=A0A1H1ZRC5_9MICO|nr:MoaD/ThiS family protein [Agromyces flavus]MCP2367227.1 molybdopterin converting factor small subunit [Agromyces flavus]GGI46149.1 molybdopterin synthase sulfur carrier subunit [Agromyces flavus]SDT36278.1 Molybdopterin converting factor, small subunit [Agromyces flavus]
MADTATTTTTTVLVRYFAAAAEAAGVEEERIVVADPDAATVGALRDLLVARYGPAMSRVVANGSFLVDGVVRRDPAAPLGAQVDVLPPFAGG